MATINHKTVIIGSILGGTAVLVSAFGAHYLENILSEGRLESYDTACQYMMYGSFFLLIVGLHDKEKKFLLPARLMLIGVLLFSGSILLLVVRDYHPIPSALLGPTTPLGGLMMISAWFVLAWKVYSLHINNVKNL